MSNTKERLKAARKAIGAKDFAEADRLCTLILEDDSDTNYTALVFRGIALQNLERYDESEVSYREAIDASAGLEPAQQILARQV